MRNNCYFLRFCTHAPKLTSHMHTNIQKIPPYSNHTHLHSHTILHTTILIHTHLHKIPYHAHHTPLHNHMIIRTKILIFHPVTHTRKYYSFNNLAQSTQLPQISWNNLRNVHSTSHGMEQLGMYHSSCALTGI